MVTDVAKRFTRAPPKANSLKVVFGVVVACGIAALPLFNKKVYQREQDVAAMRDEKYGDAGAFKDDARSQRMSIRRGPSIE